MWPTGIIGASGAREGEGGAGRRDPCATMPEGKDAGASQSMDAVFFGIDGTQAKITLGLGCNNDCRFCYNRFEKESSRPLEEARVLELVDEAAASHADHLNFIGGEVTILPYFVRALEHAKGRFPAISVNTNGRRFADEAFSLACVEAGLTEVDVSLHGSRADVHDAVSRSPGAFEETVRGLRNLAALVRERGAPLLSVTTIVLDWNLGDLVALGGLLVDVGVPSWRIKYAYGSLGRPGGDSNDYIVPYATALPVLSDVLRAHGGRLNVVVHDVPVCLLGELLAFSTIQERHRVARYTARGLEEVVTVLGRWGASASVCDGCAVRERCCRPSPAYVERFGEGELHPMSEEELEAVRARSEAFRSTVRGSGPGQGRAGRSSDPQRERIRALFESIDAAARARRWNDVRRAAEEVLSLAPEDAAATRMRRMAELHLLDDLAARCERAGDLGRARRTRLLISTHYADLAGGGSR